MPHKTGLLLIFRSSLKTLDLGLKGELTITAAMEALGNSLFLDQVPDSWAAKAYPSMAGLSIWYVAVVTKTTLSVLIWSYMQRWKEHTAWAICAYPPKHLRYPVYLCILLFLLHNILRVLWDNIFNIVGFIIPNVVVTALFQMSRFKLNIRAIMLFTHHMLQNHNLYGWKYLALLSRITSGCFSGTWTCFFESKNLKTGLLISSFRLLCGWEDSSIHRVSWLPSCR